MEFEFDPKKSAANLAKHGIDLATAQKLWHGEPLIASARSIQGEARYFAVGKIDGVFWIAVFTLRSGTVRLISCRRARKLERMAYEQQE